MFNLSGSYINPADVIEIWCGDSGNKEYPNRLQIIFRNEQSISTDYKFPANRDNAARNLAAEVDRCRPVNLDDVERVIERKVESLRRDMRKMRGEIREAKDKPWLTHCIIMRQRRTPLKARLSEAYQVAGELLT